MEELQPVQLLGILQISSDPEITSTTSFKKKKKEICFESPCIIVHTVIFLQLGSSENPCPIGMSSKIFCSKVTLTVDHDLDP